MLLPKGVLALRNVAATDKTRFAMNGVRLKRTQDGKIEACATDGKRLAIVNFDDAGDREAFPETGIKHSTPVPGFQTILSCDALKNAERSMPKGKANAKLMALALDETTANGTVELATAQPGTITRTAVPSLEGAFPPVESVIPPLDQPYGTVKIGLDAGLLLELVESLRAAIGLGGSVALLEILDGHHAVRVTVAKGQQKAFGALAPVEVAQVTPATQAAGLLMPVQVA